MVLVPAQQAGKADFANKVVPMAGMVRDVTVAVIVYMALHVIMSLESAPAVRDGRDSLATVRVIVDSMDMAVNLFVSVIRVTPYHVTLLMGGATVTRDGLGKSALCSVQEENLVQTVLKIASAESSQQITVIT